MSSLACTAAVPQSVMVRRPFTDQDLEPLKWFLYDRHYSLVPRFRILDCARDTRTLADVVADGTLEPADEAEAYAILEACFPPVGTDPWDWDLFSEADHWTTGPAIPVNAVLVPPAGPQAPAELSEAVLNYELDCEALSYWPGYGEHRGGGS